METVQQGHFTLKQIFQDHWEQFILLYPTLVTWYIAYNVWKVLSCREPDGLGFMTFACPSHPTEICHVPRSCKSRFCSVCAKVQVDKWVANMTDQFPNCPYFHVTFTVPAQFRTLLFEKRALLNAVFSASVETLLSYCKEQGLLPAITAVLHTFGSDLKRHIHIHCIISAGGLKLTGKAERYTRFIERKQQDPKATPKKVAVDMENPEWIPWTAFPYKMLRKRYQALLIEHLKAHIQKELASAKPDPDLKVFADPAVMRAFFDDLRREYKDGFFVHITEERRELTQTIAYIGRYTRRPPLSELRIKDYTGEYVAFEFKDYRNNGSKVLETLKTMEFIGRLIQHIPPHFFNVIRHYGLVASRVKSLYKNVTDELLGVISKLTPSKNWGERQSELLGKNPLICRICHRVMRFVSAYRRMPLQVVKETLQVVFS